MAAGTPFLVLVAIDGTPEAEATVPDSFQRVQWLRLPRRIADDVSARPAGARAGDEARARELLRGVLPEARQLVAELPDEPIFRSTLAFVEAEPGEKAQADAQPRPKA
jgi:hypothetical protein